MMIRLKRNQRFTRKINRLNRNKLMTKKEYKVLKRIQMKEGKLKRKKNFMKK